MKKIIRTFPWAENKKAIIDSAKKQFVLTTEPTTMAGFHDLMDACRYIPNSDIYQFIKQVADKNRFIDDTKVITELENRCLLSSLPWEATALEIAFQPLTELSNGTHLPTLWYYLDDETKAVVHFVFHKGFYAEIFFESKVEASALHLIQTEREQFLIVAVFTPNMDAYREVADFEGGICLREHKPCEKFDCLSKGGRKSSAFEEPKPNIPLVRTHDRGDSL